MMVSSEEQRGVLRRPQTIIGMYSVMNVLSAHEHFDGKKVDLSYPCRFLQDNLLDRDRAEVSRGAKYWMVLRDGRRMMCSAQFGDTSIELLLLRKLPRAGDQRVSWSALLLSCVSF